MSHAGRPPVGSLEWERLGGPPLSLPQRLGLLAGTAAVLLGDTGARLRWALSRPGITASNPLPKIDLTQWAPPRTEAVCAAEEHLRAVASPHIRPQLPHLLLHGDPLRSESRPSPTRSRSPLCRSTPARHRTLRPQPARVLHRRRREQGPADHRVRGMADGTPGQRGLGHHDQPQPVCLRASIRPSGPLPPRRWTRRRHRPAMGPTPRQP